MELARVVERVSEWRTQGTRTHTNTHERGTITTLNKGNDMNDKQFIDFINTTTTRGGRTFNLKTHNASKQARDALANSPYKALAKAHINANVSQAYYNNDEFAHKLDEVMAQLDITIIA